jgi:hypothetical protein
MCRCHMTQDDYGRRFVVDESCRTHGVWPYVGLRYEQKQPPRQEGEAK